jgi:hypothetical protein
MLKSNKTPSAAQERQIGFECLHVGVIPKSSVDADAEVGWGTAP